MYRNAQTFFLGVCGDFKWFIYSIYSVYICLQRFSCMVTTFVTNESKKFKYIFTNKIKLFHVCFFFKFP
ncbi:hypothetical protein XELAEV_18039313mg [Xenopus laevis]|uniref:Uncharacterized protein n=1 Tax=Xenopus laevis TaxID=8355 RepID=A0A974C7K1_XENLA|nr:hypothetical protein XELAEV_18039313mg [Xenopus laevis]